MAAAGQLVGDRAADSGGGAGDQRGGVGSGIGKAHGSASNWSTSGWRVAPRTGGTSAVTVYLTPQCDVG